MPEVSALAIFAVLGIGLVILIAYGLVLLGLANALTTGEDVNARLETYAVIPDAIPQRGARGRRRARLVRLRLRLNTMLSMFASETLNLQLISANWPITETEFLLIRFWVTAAAFVLGWVIFDSVLPGIGLAVLAYIIPAIYLNRAIQQRRMAFEKQLVDVLVLMSGAVRAGYSLPQSLDVVVREMAAPASDEFRRVKHEISLGLSLSQALTNLTARMSNEDLYLVVTAININSQVGGNLVTMLDAVTNTIRERVRLFSEIRVLTSQQRFNAWLLTLMPFGLGAVLFVLNPEYMSRLFEPGRFLCIPFGALFMVLLGNIVIRRLSKIEV
jgi:tight adherence protein B